MRDVAGRRAVVASAVVLAAATCLSAVGVARAAAVTVKVTNLEDSGAGSLRDTLVGLAPGSVVTFAPHLSGTIGLLSPLTMPDHVTINGPGARKLAVSGQDQTTIFDIPVDTTATISGLSLIHGRIPREAGGAVGVTGPDGGSANVSPCVAGSDHDPYDASFGGRPPAVGGAVDNLGALTLRAVTISDNTVFGASGHFVTAHGGNGGEGSSSISCSARGGNGEAVQLGGGGGGYAEGGGIFSSGTLRVYDSTIDHNRVFGGTGGDSLAISGNGGPGGEFGAGGAGGDASVTAGQGGEALGGGVYIEAGSALIVNTTVTANVGRPGKPGTATATQGSYGGGYPGHGGLAGVATATPDSIRLNGVGGLWLDAYGSTKVTLRDDTIAANSATAVMGAANLLTAPHSDVSIEDTILADPKGGLHNCAGRPHTTSFSLVSDRSCAMTAHTDQRRTNPRLERLSDNGGPVDTMALRRSSPAVDNGRAFGEHTDARGHRRPVDIKSIPNRKGGHGADIGAYELKRPPKHHHK